MSTPTWRQQGFLTPDAFEAQREVWALQSRMRGLLAEVHDQLAMRTAEPSWGAALSDAAANARQLRDALHEEAGHGAAEIVACDELVLVFESSVAEVASSGHVPSLLVMGYVVLGELGTLPVRLLSDVAGPHAGMMCGRIVAADGDHGLLGRLHGILAHDDRTLGQLRKLVQHLTTQLADVYASWRQTFHTLGLDGEWLVEDGAAALRAAHHELGLKVTRADLKPFSV